MINAVVKRDKAPLSLLQESYPDAIGKQGMVIRLIIQGLIMM
jgi:hypothetical protein